MNFKQFWNGLTKEEQVMFAKQVGCSRDVVRNDYLSPNPLRRPQPSKKKLARMILFSQNRLKLGTLLKYFCGEGVAQLVAEKKKESPVSGA